MANKHICCLKPRRCSVCKIQMGCRCDTLREIAGATEQLENTHCSLTGLANLYAWEGCHAVGDVLCCAGSRKNSKHISWIIERTDLERGKKCCLALVGRLDLWAARHSVSQPVIDGGLLIISVLDTPENTSVTYSDYISWPLPAWKQGRGLVTSAVDKVLLWENTHLFCLFGAPNWTFAYLPEQYVNSTCATFSHFTPEGFRAQSQS